MAPYLGLNFSDISKASDEELEKAFQAVWESGYGNFRADISAPVIIAEMNRRSSHRASRAADDVNAVILRYGRIQIWVGIISTAASVLAVILSALALHCSS